MADALNECPRRDGKCPIYVMGNDDQNPTGFLMCDDCGAIGDDPTYRPKKALSADGNVSAGRSHPCESSSTRRRGTASRASVTPAGATDLLTLAALLRQRRLIRGFNPVPICPGTSSRLIHEQPFDRSRTSERAGTLSWTARYR